ncbi:hypothetical protein QI165_09905 [Staphylococcus saprophyticus]|nr:hypothetical protein [Staphylococcus saprophyticus]
MDNYSMNDYSLNDITLVDKKYYSELKRKAKAMDEIEQSYWKSNTPENFAYEFVRIFENRFSSDKDRADDER